MLLRTAVVVLATLLACAPVHAAATYRDHPEAKVFAAEMASRHGFAEAEVLDRLAEASRQQGILDAISKPAERTLTWGEYRNIFVKPRRINEGVAFWREHADTLARAEATYGVPPEVVTAIIGVETFYGRHRGKHRVLDALATLAFDYPPRAPFFRRQLEAFLVLAREEGKVPGTLHGSYAGAMGYGQFIPSSYRAYAVDFDGDGVRDIWDNPVDAIGSVANYLAEHGWQPGADVAVTLPVLVRPGADVAAVEAAANSQLQPSLGAVDLARLGLAVPAQMPVGSKAALFRMVNGEQADYWLGLPNFYVITRYNHSRLYAMAVWQLAQAIAAEAAASQTAAREPGVTDAG